MQWLNKNGISRSKGSANFFYIQRYKMKAENLGGKNEARIGLMHICTPIIFKNPVKT